MILTKTLTSVTVHALHLRIFGAERVNRFYAQHFHREITPNSSSILHGTCLVLSCTNFTGYQTCSPMRLSFSNSSSLGSSGLGLVSFGSEGTSILTVVKNAIFSLEKLGIFRINMYKEYYLVLEPRGNQLASIKYFSNNKQKVKFKLDNFV